VKTPRSSNPRAVYDWFTPRVCATGVWLVAVLVLPTGTDESFAQDPVIDLLEREYQHRPILDHEGREAELFGARTSGQAYAYSLGGRLLFCGGLTPARGQTGYTPSLHKLRTSLQHRVSEPVSCTVFGCSLQNPPQRLDD